MYAQVLTCWIWHEHATKGNVVIFALDGGYSGVCFVMLWFVLPVLLWLLLGLDNVFVALRYCVSVEAMKNASLFRRDRKQPVCEMWQYHIWLGCNCFSLINEPVSFLYIYLQVLFFPSVSLSRCDRSFLNVYISTGSAHSSGSTDFLPRRKCAPPFLLGDGNTALYGNGIGCCVIRESTWVLYFYTASLLLLLQISGLARSDWTKSS